MTFAKKIYRCHLVCTLAALVAALGSCDKPRTIPDETLELIFRDIYVANSYVSTRDYTVDSIEMYLPIFEKYDCTVEDLKYTIESFSKRKSTKFSDVIAAAKERIDNEYKEIAASVRVLDYIDSVAAERYKMRIFARDSIRVRKAGDTSALRIEIPIPGDGRYKVEYTYVMDTSDRNRSIRGIHTLYDKEAGKRTATTNNWFARGRRRDYSVELEAFKGEDVLLLQLGNYSANNMKRPHLGIDSLRVTYYPSRQAFPRLSYARTDAQLGGALFGLR